MKAVITKLTGLLATILFLSLAPAAYATDYYVSPSGSDSNNGTSQSTPWKTLGKVQNFLNSSAQPGDRVLFQRGQVWTGTLLVSTIWGYNGKSGTRTNPIYIGAYGTGAKPRFTGATTIASFQFMGVKNYVIDGLNFEDIAFDPADKVTAAPTACGIRLGMYQEVDTDSITVKNCSFSNIGLAVVMDGSYNKMDSCTVTNMKNVKSTYSTTYPGNDDDYGANPVTIYGNYNEVTNSYISGGWAESWDYGWNGGAIEFFDNCNYNKIMYNTFYDCGGIAEFGAYVANATATDNLIAYNRIINCGNLSWCNTTGTFAIQVSNVQYFNNVIIENAMSRFSGPNTGAGVVTPGIRSKIYPEPDHLAFSGTPAASVVYNLKNNIFLLYNGQSVVRSSGVANKTTHTNNVFRFYNGSKANFTLNTSELITTTRIFTDTSSTDPVNWDLTLPSTSPANNFATFVGISRDFAGNPVPSVNPNSGIFEDVISGTALAASASAGAIACNGGTTTVTVSASGGTAPYTGTGTFTVTAGTYTYTVTDAAGATASRTITVSQPAALSVSVSTGTIATFGGTTSATVTATGGTGTKTYQLNSGLFQSSNVFTGIAAGSYTVTVKDANGCTKTATFTITQPAQLTASSMAGNIICNGGNTTVTVSATGGVSPYSGTGSFSVVAGTYTYTVTDANGASATTSVTVSQPSAISASLSAGTITTNGGTTSITVTASGGTGTLSYQLNGGAYQSSSTFNGVAAGTHTVTIKDANGCTVTRSITISQPAAVSATATSGSIACNGGSTTVTVSASGGTAPYTGTGTFTVTAGTYTYTVTDAAGATASTSITVGQPTSLGGSVATGTILVYGGTTTATFTATGGTAPYTFSLNGGAYQSSNVFSGVAAGSHSITVKDANGCTRARTFTLTEPAQLVASSTATTITCAGGTATVTVSATGGVSPYTGTTTYTVSAGTYTYTVTDANGASATTSITVTQPAALTLSVSAGTITVNGGTTTVTASAGGGTGTKTFKLDNGAYQSGNTFAGVTAGSHTVTVKDANGCTKSQTFTISQPSALTVTATPGTISCFGGSTSVTVAATGGTAPYTGTGSFTVSAGTYSYTVTDASGTTASASVTVSQPAAISVNVSAGTITVPGGTTTVSVSANGGTGSYLYKLNNGAYQSSNVFTGVSAGSHTVTVKDANGCTSARAFTIESPTNPLSASASATQILCNGGSAMVTVTATGGTAPYVGTGMFTVTAGTYNYTVQDANGNTVVTSIVVAQPAVLTASVAAGTITINGGSTSATVTASGGTAPYSYSLDGGAYQSSNVFTGVLAGSHNMVIRDANGCTVTRSFSITQPDGLVVTVTQSAAILCNGGTANITVSATGGRAPYTGTGNFTVSAGAHTFTVTDANGASASQTITVTQPTLIEMNVTTGIMGLGETTTTATIDALGGTGTYYYSVDGSAFQSGNTFAGLAVGDHMATVLDQNGCTATQNFAISLNLSQNLTLNLVNKTNVTCRGGYDGSVEVMALGGAAPYTYSINNGRYTPLTLFKNLPAGTYQIHVKDAMSNTSTITVTVFDGRRRCSNTGMTGRISVTAYPNPSTSFFKVAIESEDDQDVTVSVFSMDGKPVHTEKGKFDKTYQFGQNLKPGTYIIKVTQGDKTETKTVVKGQ